MIVCDILGCGMGAVDQDMKRVLDETGHRDTPVVLTSSISRLGRDEMWRYLRAVVGDKSKGGGAQASRTEEQGGEKAIPR